MKKVKVAVIGGTGFEKLFNNAKQLRLETSYGAITSLFIGKLGDKDVAFLLRHGLDHSAPPHEINYRANIYGLWKAGVERVIAINAVGAINRNFRPADIVIPHDFIDFTKLRSTTFYDEAPVTHIDVSQPYCPELRKLLIETARRLGLQTRSKAVLVCTEGPRFETPAEIEMFRRLGCDVVGMTGLPEAVLARELEMCYASFCFVSNMAAGIQEQLAPLHISEISQAITPKLEQVLASSVKTLPPERGNNCSCACALRNARIKK